MAFLTFICEVEPDVWTGRITAFGVVISAITGLITAIGIAVSIARSDKRGKKVAVAQQAQLEQGAKAIKQNENLEKKADDTLQAMNGPLTHAMKAAATATAALAEKTGKVDDIRKANTAADILKDHQSGKQAVERRDFLKDNGV